VPGSKGIREACATRHGVSVSQRDPQVYNMCPVGTRHTDDALLPSCWEAKHQHHNNPGSVSSEPPTVKMLFSR
jgi:hypothetical protein